MNQYFRLCVLGVTLLLSTMSLAAEEGVSTNVSANILSKLQTARPDFTYGAVSATPIPGLYSVQVVKGPLLFVSADGKFALDGNIYGVGPRGFIDLKELAMVPRRQAALKAVSLSDMIVFPAIGETKAFVYVFTDVDCGYCRKLHREVPAMNAKGIEIRYLAFPRAGIDSPSHKKIAKAWCAKDRNDALTRLKNNQPLDVAYCNENPVAAQFMLGTQLGVRGTPALVLEDGTLLPGYLPADELAKVLNIDS